MALGVTQLKSMEGMDLFFQPDGSWMLIWNGNISGGNSTLEDPILLPILIHPQ